MDQRVVDLLRGQATEFTDQSEKAIEEDPIYTGWDVTLKNCQVMLQGHENSGCMCLTAEKMRWLRHEYKRAWRDGQYLDKFRLKGDLKGMQLFSLTSTDLPDHCLWVPVDQINQEFSPDLDPPEKPPGESSYVKIVHSCSVTINYISYCPIPANIEIPPISSEDFMRDANIMSRERTINTLTLTQENLEIWTETSQYDLALDLVNHLFLHVEPGMKERWERLLMRGFQLSLQEDLNVEQKVHKVRERLISQAIELQDEIRRGLALVRAVENELFRLMMEKEQSTEDRIESFNEEISEKEAQLNEEKDILNNRSEEMAVTLQLAKETHLKHQLLKDEEKSTERQTRRTHFNFHEIQWKLVSKDVVGHPKGVANFILRNFEYRSVASVESDLHQKSNQNHHTHEFKVGDFELKNLLEDQKFGSILKPDDPSSRSNAAFRVFCKVKPPVNGIPVKERIELNMKPLTLQVTYEFYRALRAFFFPEDAVSNRIGTVESDSKSDPGSSVKAKSRQLLSKFRNTNPSASRNEL